MNNWLKSGIFLFLLILFSAGVFSDPIIYAFSPENGSYYEVGELVNFKAYVADQKYGNGQAAFAKNCGYPNNPTNECFTWFSSLDGFLGYGVGINKDLTEGTHTITFTATNPDNESTSMQILIFVGINPYNYPPSINLPTTWEIDESKEFETLDLWQYANDADDDDDDLDFWIVSESNTNTVNCHIQSGRYLKCYPYNEGFSYVKVRVEDPEGFYAEDTVKIVVSDSFSGTNLELVLPAEWEMDKDDSIQSIDLWDYTDFDGDYDDLDYEIDSETNTAVADCYISGKYLKCNPKKKGTSTVYVDVSGDGETDSDYVKITVIDQGTGSGNLELILPEEWEIYENEQTDSIDLLDYTYYDGDEADLDYEITSESGTSIVDCYISGTYLKCNPKKKGTSKVYVKVDDGYETDSDYVNVTVIDGGTSTTGCSNLEINTFTVSLNEGTYKISEFELKNNSGKKFFIDSMEAYDSSSYFDTAKYSAPDYVNGNNKAKFKVKIESNEVSGNKTGTAYVKVKGHFSGQNSCTKTESFTVKINDLGSSNGNNDFDNNFNYNYEWDSSSVVLVSPKSLVLNKGESEGVSMLVRNLTDSTQCYEISFNSGTKYIKTEIQDIDEFCLDEAEYTELKLRVLAETDAVPGYYSPTIETKYHGKTDRQSISVKVTADKAPAAKEEVLSLSGFTSEIESFEDETELEFTVENKSDETINDVLISIEGLPENARFEPVLISFIGAKNARTVKGKLLLKDVAAGEYKTVIKVQSGNEMTAKEMALKVTEKAQEENGFISGLIGLGSTAGIIIGFIILLVLAVAIIYYAIKPHN
ncbi:MAG: hypothetical protein ABIA76_00885 [Candidatus Diapherotrites archaeon]